MWKKQRYCWQIQSHVWITNFPRVEQNYYHARKVWASLRGPTIWRVMPRNVWSDIVSWQTRRLNNSTEYQLHALMTIISKKKNWNPWENCQKYAHKNVLKCLYLARIGRSDLLWSVNELVRAITKRTRASDKRFARLISYTQHTHEFKQCCHVGNKHSTQCRLGLFQDSDFAGDLEDSKSTLGGILCIFGSHWFVPTSWMCKNQTSVSHSSTEAERISLHAGLRMDGIPALDLWNLVIEVCHYTQNQSNKAKDSLAQEDLLHRVTSNKRTKNQSKAPPTHDHSDLFHVDNVPSNVRFSVHCYVVRRKLCCCVWRQWSRDKNDNQRQESNNETCVKDHRVSLDWLFDRKNLDPEIQIKYIDTNTRLQTYWQREIAHLTNGTIFFICSTSAISALSAVPRISAWWAAPKRWRKRCKNRKKKTRWWRNPNQRQKTWPVLFLQVLHLWTVRLRQELRVERLDYQGNLPQAKIKVPVPTQRRVFKDGKGMLCWS